MTFHSHHNLRILTATRARRAGAMKRSVSFDYQSIGQSLKRVRISTSPGELRIDRDIESLISSEEWTSTAQTANTTTTLPHHHVNRHCSPMPIRRIHSEILCSNARLVRDSVDPLKLRLTCTPNDNSQSSEQWTFCIQMPRMYPHVPPCITSATRDFVRNDGNNMSSNSNLDYSVSTTMVPVKVVVRLAPMHKSEFDSNRSSYFDIDSATFVYASWSPVSSLQDLIEFLMEIPRRLHQQHHNFLRNNATGNAPVVQPTIAPDSQSFAKHEHQHFQSIHETTQQKFSCDMSDNSSMNIDVVESRMEDTQHDLPRNLAERHLNPYRFDVGYEKSPSRAGTGACETYMSH